MQIPGPIVLDLSRVQERKAVIWEVWEMQDSRP